MRSIKQKVPTDFESQWRRRFEGYGRLFTSEAKIAGWTPNGLATRLKIFEELAGQVRGNWLDVGCGAGTYVRALLRGGAEGVTGVDYSVPSLLKARDLAVTEGARWLAADARRLPFPEATFSGVMCFGVTQALAESDALVRELVRVTAPGGDIWVDGLNRGCLWHRAKLISVRLRGGSPRLRFESPQELRRALLAAGCREVGTHWVPIFPKQYCQLQEIVRRFLQRLPVAGSPISHAFMIHCCKES